MNESATPNRRGSFRALELLHGALHAARKELVIARMLGATVDQSVLW